jgi:hypothetical protein
MMRSGATSFAWSARIWSGDRCAVSSASQLTVAVAVDPAWVRKVPSETRVTAVRPTIMTRVNAPSTMASTRARMLRSTLTPHTIRTQERTTSGVVDFGRAHPSWW